MVRTAFISVVALSASANAFFAPITGTSLAMPRVSGPMQMVTSPGVSTTPAVASPAGGGNMVSSEEAYTATLKKMEAESIADLEKAFDETAKKAKEASDKIWGDLEAEFAEDEA
ncbi:unnamed protein product [Hapterophycus canaliculatus]